MADNQLIKNNGSDFTSAARDVTYSGDAGIKAQVVGLVAFSGADDAKTAADLPGDATNGLLVNLGVNNDVTVTNTVTVTGSVAVSGTATIAGTVSVSSIAAGDNNIGNVDVVTLPALPPGTNNIGDVDVLSLPALPAGTNNIGDVDVLTLPSLPAGGNTIGAVNQAGTWNITNVSGTISLPTGASTAANQSTIITALQLIDNAVGTAGAAAGTGLYRIGGTDGTLERIVSVNTSGHVNIADGGNSITVDAPIATPVNVQIGDGTRTATVRDTGATDALNVAIVDASGNQIVSFGGSSSTVTEDDAAVPNPNGPQIMARRRDTLAAEVTTDADHVALNATNKGELYVKHADAIIIGDGSNTATIRNLASNDALNVAIVDGSGNHLTSFGGGTQYSNGAAQATPTGTVAMGHDGSNVKAFKINGSAEQIMALNSLSIAHASSADGATALTNSAQAIKASGGQLHGYYIYNPNAAAVAYVLFYNVAAASVTVGTTNPAFMLAIPAGGAANLSLERGINFSTAMSWAATSTADGNGALATAVDAVCWYI